MHSPPLDTSSAFSAANGSNGRKRFPKRHRNKHHLNNSDSRFDVVASVLIVSSNHKRCCEPLCSRTTTYAFPFACSGICARKARVYQLLESRVSVAHPMVSFVLRSGPALSFFYAPSYRPITVSFPKSKSNTFAAASRNHR